MFIIRQNDGILTSKRFCDINYLHSDNIIYPQEYGIFQSRQNFTPKSNFGLMKSQARSTLNRSQLNTSLTSSKLGTSRVSTNKVSTTKKKLNSPVPSKILKKPSINTSMSTKQSLKSSTKVSTTPKKSTTTRTGSKQLQRASTQLIHSKVDEILDDETSEVGRSIRSSRNNSMIVDQEEPSILQSQLAASQHVVTKQETESYRSQSRDLRSQIDQIRRQNQELESKLGRKIILKENQANPFSTTSLLSSRQLVQQSQQPFLKSQSIQFPVVQNRVESPTVSLPSRPEPIQRQESIVDLRQSQLQTGLQLAPSIGAYSQRQESAKQKVENIVHNSDDYKIASGAIKKADVSHSFRNSQTNIQGTPKLITTQNIAQTPQQIQEINGYDNVVTQQAIKTHPNQLQNQLSQSLTQALRQDNKRVNNNLKASLTDSQLAVDEVPIQQTFQQRVCFNNKVEEHPIVEQEELQNVMQQQQLLQQQISQDQGLQNVQTEDIQEQQHQQQQQQYQQQQQQQQTVPQRSQTPVRSVGQNIFLQRAGVDIPQQQLIQQPVTPVLSQQSHQQVVYPVQQQYNLNAPQPYTTQMEGSEMHYSTIQRQHALQLAQPVTYRQNLRTSQGPAYQFPPTQMHTFQPISTEVPGSFQVPDPRLQNQQLHHSGLNLNGSQVTYSRPIRTSLTPEEFHIQQLKVYNGIPITSAASQGVPESFHFSSYNNPALQKPLQQHEMASLISTNNNYLNQNQNAFTSVHQSGLFNGNNTQTQSYQKMAPDLNQSPPGQAFRTLLIPNQLAICDFNKFDALPSHKQAQILNNLQQKEAFQVNRHVIDLVFGKNPVNASIFKSTKLGNKILELIQNYDVYNLKIMFIEMLMSQKVSGDCDCIFDAYIQLTSRS